MRKTVALAVLTFSLLTIGKAAVGGVPQAGDIGIFFDAAGTTTAIADIDALEPFPLYVVAFSVQGGLSAYEFSVGIPINAIGGAQMPSNPEAVNTSTGDNDFIVGTGAVCLAAAAQVLVTYTSVMFLTSPAEDTEICLGHSSPSSGPAVGLPEAPLYISCSSPGEIRPFGAAYHGCAVINPNALTPPIPNALTSWGTVKSAYDN